jgi:hypothetical protein
VMDLDATDERFSAASHLRATVPTAALDDCHACKLMLQIAHVEEHGDVATFSEARFAIARGDS